MMIPQDIIDIILEYYILKCRECLRYIFDKRVYDSSYIFSQQNIRCNNCGKWSDTMLNFGRSIGDYYNHQLNIELKIRNEYFKGMKNKNRHEFDRGRITKNLW